MVEIKLTEEQKQLLNSGNVFERGNERFYMVPHIFKQDITTDKFYILEDGDLEINSSSLELTNF